ncbi:F5J5.18 [Arabidopsis thaliana]|uniref:F5J5.18 n=1 Tax=Arabidopsis thaliana TaxID=3702 RepID=Q9SKV2_ARATH|nr:F5J5.18 [Arabidopsis thaliana]
MLANPLPFSPLRSLNPYKNTWRIQIKLRHVWRQYSVKAGESIEMILVDEAIHIIFDGDKIYAAVRREQIKKFEKYLTEGVWKIITTITLNPTNLMGQVVDRTEIQDLNTNNKPTKKINFHMRYMQYKQSIPLGTCQIVDKACKKSTDGIVVCLIRFAKINLYNDNRSISNSFDVSQVFVDSTLAELALFKQNIPNDGLTLGNSDSFHKRHYAPKIGDDDDHHPRQTIMEVLTVTVVLSINLWVSAKLFVFFRPLIQTDLGTIFVVVLTIRRLSKRKLSNGKMSRHLKNQDFGGTYAMAKLDACYSIVMQRIFLAPLPLNCLMIENPTVLPDVINSLKGKTFQFLLFYTGNIADEIVLEDSNILSLKRYDVCSQTHRSDVFVCLHPQF